MVNPSAGTVVALRSDMERLLIPFVVSTVACVPSMPSALLETTEVLDANRVAITVGGGGAGIANTSGGATGFAAGEVRLRVGVGGKQELGLDVFGGAGDSPTAGAAGGRFAYKIGPAPWLAFVATGGAYDLITQGSAGGTTHTAVFGGDLAAIVAPPAPPDQIRVYGGLRGSFAIPVFDGSTSATEALTIPVGVSLPLSESVRFAVEGGFVAAWAEYSAPTLSANITDVGGYGAVGLRFALQ